MSGKATGNGFCKENWNDASEPKHILSETAALHLTFTSQQREQGKVSFIIVNHVCSNSWLKIMSLMLTTALTKYSKAE